MIRSRGWWVPCIADPVSRVRAIRKEIVSDPDMAVEYFLLQREQSKTDHLLSCDLEDFSAEDLVKRVDQYHRYSTIGSALLYRDVNFKGGSKFFSSPGRISSGGRTSSTTQRRQRRRGVEYRVRAHVVWRTTIVFGWSPVRRIC